MLTSLLIFAELESCTHSRAMLSQWLDWRVLTLTQYSKHTLYKMYPYASVSDVMSIYRAYNRTDILDWRHVGGVWHYTNISGYNNTRLLPFSQIINGVVMCSVYVNGTTYASPCNLYACSLQFWRIVCLSLCQLL